VTAHSFSSPLRWGFLAPLPWRVSGRCGLANTSPPPVGVCRFAVSSRSPYPRGGFSGSFSAIARASLLAPPLWGWVKRIPSAPQRGGFSCYRSCPPSWESVPTKISPFRWEFVALAQLASPTSVGVFPIDPDCPTPWESIARIGQPHQRGGKSYVAKYPHHRGSLSVLLKYTCVTFFQKKFYPQLFKPAHRKGLAPYL
jgi:hypothetical protein